MQIYLDDKIKKFFDPHHCLFEQIMQLQGDTFRSQKGRNTQRIQLGEHSYFIKQHYGVGWKEILKNILQLRWPAVSAMNEVSALQKLASLNSRVPKILGYGLRGRNPATQQSFVILEDIMPIMDLEQYVKTWHLSFKQKNTLIKTVAEFANTLHQNGINHRDLYLCHFLLQGTTRDFVLYLIDLHRAQLRNKVPMRWLKKDLSALYFSSIDVRLSQRDLYRFMKYYRRQSLRDILGKEIGFWQQVRRRGEKIYRDHQSA